MQVKAEYRRAARDQIAFIPARQIAAGIPLEQRIAVPDRRRDQQQRNGNGGDPDQAGFGQADAQNLRIDVTFLGVLATLPAIDRVPESANSRGGLA
jgi:hypothetical protein